LGAIIRRFFELSISGAIKIYYSQNFLLLSWGYRLHRLMRLSDFYLRLHEFLIALFLFITAPVRVHIIAKAALYLRLEFIEKARGKPWE
jgi:multisubunit Na+/H+ antiporter MnhG subunit